MKDAKEFQTHEFKPHEQIIDNLKPDENILYKIKVSKRTSSLKSMNIFFMVLIILVIAEFFIFTIWQVLTVLFIPILFLILFFQVGITFGMYIFMTKVLNKPTPQYFYITNKKLFKIYGDPKKKGTIKTLPLDKVQAVSYIKKGRFDRYFSMEITSERINYSSEISKGRSYNFTILKDLESILNVVESILWHNSELEKRLGALKKNLEIIIPYTFNDLKEVSSLTLYNDKIVYNEDEYSLEVPFSQSFYLTYRPRTKTKGSLYIKPSYNSSEEIKFKLGEAYLKILELIYLHSLSWKHKNNLLLDKEIVETLNTQISRPNRESTIHKKAVKMESIDISRETLNPYQKYINSEKGEKVLFCYMPNVITKTFIFISALIIMGIFSLIYALYFIDNPPIENIIFSIMITLSLLMFGTIFGMGAPLFLLGYGSERFSKYIFTSEKIIIKRFKKLGYTPYSNISSITYNIRLYSQFIKIELKNPLKSEQFLDKKTINISFVPRKLKLFKKIQNFAKK